MELSILFSVMWKHIALELYANQSNAISILLESYCPLNELEYE